MPLYPSLFRNHSCNEWDSPDVPPPPRVTAGIPLEIGIFESVELVLRRGLPPRYLLAAIARCTIGVSSSVHPDGRSPTISIFKVRAAPLLRISFCCFVPSLMDRWNSVSILIDLS